RQRTRPEDPTDAVGAALLRRAHPQQRLSFLTVCAQGPARKWRQMRGGARTHGTHPGLRSRLSLMASTLVMSSAVNGWIGGGTAHAAQSASAAPAGSTKTVPTKHQESIPADPTT